MSKKFEYELTLRLEKAEKAVASLASKIENDLGKSVEKAFKGSTEFDAGPMTAFQKQLLKLEEDRLAVVRKRIEIERAYSERKLPETSYQGSSEFGGTGSVTSYLQQQQQKTADTIASIRKSVEESNASFLASIRKDAQASADVIEEEANREIKYREDMQVDYDTHMADRQAKNEKAVAEQKKQSEARAKEQQKQEDAHAQRLSNNSKLLKEYYANYSDPKAISALNSLQKTLDRHSESLKISGLTQAEQNRLHAEYTKQKLADLDRVVGKETKENQSSIDRIQKQADATKAANLVRYKDHQEVLSRIAIAEQANADALAQIRVRASTLTKQQLNDELRAHQQLAKARIDVAVEAGYQQEAANNRLAANGSRMVSKVFQVQQAIEDASYAGLRGAANNIAALLTSMTNPWVAVGGLIAVATVQLASHLGVLEKINESYDGLLWRTEKQIENEKKAAEIRVQSRNAEFERQRDMADFNPIGQDINALKSRIALTERQIQVDIRQSNELSRQVQLYDEMKKLAGKMPTVDIPGLQTWNNPGSLFGGAEKPEDLMKAWGEIRPNENLFSALAGGLNTNPDQLEAAIKRINETMAEMKKLSDEYAKISGRFATEEDAAAAKKERDGIDAKIAKKREDLKTDLNKLSIAQQFRDVSKEIIDLENQNTFKGIGNLGPNASGIAETMAKDHAFAVADMKQEYEQQMKTLSLQVEATSDLKKQNDLRNQMLEITNKYKQQLEDIRNDEQGLLQFMQDRKRIVDEAVEKVDKLIEIDKDRLKIAEEAARLSEKEISNKDKEIEKAQQKLDKLKEEKSLREDMLAKEELARTNAIVEAGAKDDLKKNQENLKSVKELGEQNYKNYIARLQQQEQFNKLYAQGKGTKFNIGQGFDELKRQADLKRDYDLKMLDQMAQDEEDRINKKAAKEKQLNLDNMEAIQKEKAKNLKNEAADLIGQGQFDKAMEAAEKLKSVLDEIKEAKEQAFSGADSKKEKMDLDKQIKDMNPQLESVNALMQKIAEEKKKAATEQKAEAEIQHAADMNRVGEIKNSLEQNVQIKQELGNLPVFPMRDLQNAQEIINSLREMVRLKSELGNMPAGIQGPMPAPGFGGPAPGMGVPLMPGLGMGGNPFTLNFNMNSATPNSVAAAAQSIVQGQKARAMLE